MLKSNSKLANTYSISKDLFLWADVGSCSPLIVKNSTIYIWWSDSFDFTLMEKSIHEYKNTQAIFKFIFVDDTCGKIWNERKNLIKWATTHDFQQCGILTSIDSDELVQPPFMLRNSKWCSVGSLSLIDYSSD